MDLVEEGYDEDEGDLQEEEGEDKETVQELKGRVIDMEVRTGEEQNTWGGWRGVRDEAL